MPNSICFEKSKESAVTRLPFLPRIGLVVDFAGHRFTYRQAPMIETLVNLFKRGPSLKALADVASKQLKEIQLHPLKSAPKSKKTDLAKT